MSWSTFTQSGPTYSKVIIVTHLHGQLVVKPSIHLGIGFLIKDLVFLGKTNKSTAITLVLEQGTQTSIVSQTPKEKDHDKEHLTCPSRQQEQETDFTYHCTQCQKVKKRLLFSRIDKPCHHITRCRYTKHFLKEHSEWYTLYYKYTTYLCHQVFCHKKSETSCSYRHCNRQQWMCQTCRTSGVLPYHQYCDDEALMLQSSLSLQLVVEKRCGDDTVPGWTAKTERSKKGDPGPTFVFSFVECWDSRERAWAGKMGYTLTI